MLMFANDPKRTSQLAGEASSQAGEAAESTRRDDMAKAAAPYLHPRLSSIEHTSYTEEFRKAAEIA